ncbi:nuclear transport factor 2 family protein [Aureimonas mangrovi]|uniref:nuclear transport factor 2 family protein n=1 Tax=Aureimonas mangrovi TaxID=2758041 RepID=UPI00163DA6D3|nr:nuclear transport factor 2 family protein [Aureimonas mangrovi]
MKRSYIRHGLCLSLVAAGLAALGTLARAEAPDPAAERNAAIVREAFDRWAAGGSVFDPLLSPELRWTIHGSGPVAGTYDRESFLEDASIPLVSRLSEPVVPEVHAIWSVGDTVIVRFDGSGTTTSGAPYENQFVWIFQMEDGLVVEAEAFLDLVAYDEVVENNEPLAE